MYGIRPWELDLMTDGEILEYFGQLEETRTRQEQSQVRSIRTQQRHRLGLGDPPHFPHRR